MERLESLDNLDLLVSEVCVDPVDHKVLRDNLDSLDLRDHVVVLDLLVVLDHLDLLEKVVLLYVIISLYSDLNI